ANMDALVFERELLIQREVVMPVRMNLIAPPGTELGDVRRVMSFPHAIAQCRGFFAARLPGVEEVAATSTADAVRLVAEERPAGTAALGPALAAKLYGLEVLADDVEAHADNATRVVLAGPVEAGVPPLTGHDRPGSVCFQR